MKRRAKTTDKMINGDKATNYDEKCIYFITCSPVGFMF